MHIHIAQKLKPYSHVPGSSCLLPGSFFRVQIFPGRIRFYDLRTAFPSLHAEIPVKIQGPMKDFTLLQDLEQGFISVWGQTKTGYLRYKIYGFQDQFSILTEKAPPGDPPFAMLSQPLKQHLPISQERLSLGSHKAQDWEGTRRRLAFEEIFPLWLRLGQLLPEFPYHSWEGTATLLKVCQQAIHRKERLAILPSFTTLFLAGFEGMLSPRLQDDDYHGLNLPSPMPHSPLSPLVLLSEGSLLIRSLFLQQESKLLRLLPALPPTFHCGRFIGIQCQHLGVLDLEWSKKKIRRVILHAEQEEEFQLEVPDVTSFRLRKGTKDRGERFPVSRIIKITPQVHYFLDNFMQ